MFKQLGCSLICATALLSTTAFATQHSMQILMKGYSFKPNETVNLKNPLFFTLKLNCQIKTVGINNLEIVVQKKSASINDLELSEGQSHVLAVSDGMSMKLSAAGSAVVDITNRGKEVVNVECSLG